jgi:O-methyltransferase involved in polyketide biosynthesis
LIFDYLLASVLAKTPPSREAQRLRNHCASEGEPILFGLKEGSLEEFLASRGFKLVENMTAQSLKDAYFKEKGSQRKVFPLAAIACARVKSSGEGH